MKPKTEEFLNFLLWTALTLANPTVRNLTDSYESWAYRNGLGRQMTTLQRRKLVEQVDGHPGDRLYRLTVEGRLRALGGRDPQAQWSRRWDGGWRVILFDIPTAREAFRMQLRRYLLSRGFGCLQGSVWVTPDRVDTELKRFGQNEVNVNSLVLLDARPCAGESDEQIVSGAWDFKRINDRYRQHIKVLTERPQGNLDGEGDASSLRRWAAEEREAWLDAVRWDPLLPERLLPAGYLGKEAWKQKMQTLKQAAQQLRSFRFSQTLSQV